MVIAGVGQVSLRSGLASLVVYCSDRGAFAEAPAKQQARYPELEGEMFNSRLG